jgi:hypothetical protein
VANKVPSLGTAISLDGGKVHSRVANEVPSLRAAISLDGGKVHTRVANEVPSLGAAISLDGGKVHVGPQIGMNPKPKWGPRFGIRLNSYIENISVFGFLGVATVAALNFLHRNSILFQIGDPHFGLGFIPIWGPTYILTH